MSQQRLAEVTGMAIATYQRLERGQMPNPPLAYLVNCAIALEVRLKDILEDDWLEWHAFSRATARPPQRGWYPRKTNR